MRKSYGYVHAMLVCMCTQMQEGADKVVDMTTMTTEEAIAHTKVSLPLRLVFSLSLSLSLSLSRSLSLTHAHTHTHPLPSLTLSVSFPPSPLLAHALSITRFSVPRAHALYILPSFSSPSSSFRSVSLAPQPVHSLPLSFARERARARCAV